MQVISTAWDVLGAAIVFLAGAGAAIFLARYFKVPQKRSLFLYCWHTVFSLLYLRYALNSGGLDAAYYYEQSFVHTGLFWGGTEFVVFFTSLFTKSFGMSYLGMFLVFNIFGFAGMLAFYGSIRKAVEGKSPGLKKTGFFVVLLPSVSFWSAALGKDAISFMAACFFLWGAIDLRNRVPIVLIAIISMFLVRMHVAALMVASIAMASIFSSNLSTLARAFLLAISIAGAAFIVPLSLQYLDVGTQGTQDVLSYVEQRQSLSYEGGSGLDISTMSYPMQLITYVFRPLPFEAHNATSLAASLENIFLLIIFAAGGYALLRSRKWQFSGDRLILWMYALSAWTMLAVTTANLGIAVRQKWMFVPILLYLIFFLVGKARRVSSNEDTFRR